MKTRRGKARVRKIQRKEGRVYIMADKLTMWGNSLAIASLPPNILRYLLALDVPSCDTDSFATDPSHTGNKEQYSLESAVLFVIV
jgi:hypothetical protein